ncbi:lipoate--protein ligase family protein [Macrococcoides caseolyticum]|uniref:Octanoyl-[GcvH]:protein N-octanoyltransferase n=1 Tax=Macrococcus psychrotolerans TaxID=3039389 RepID=A0AAU6RG42_9STAP|nr:MULTISPECIES: lipoate--protein ligase family protein [Macrococcus]MBQ5152284.1 lipoate--protein ligase family protein [Macrococcus caseolyticus]MDJ1112079.1 lipoate--protein ligase family protein [Macrococcus sp. S115]QYA32735.1 lipoate--protein ligase family protein [Macrococcus sp. 19Msa1099]QYA37548.1 lipoate--protein ligase family protein [Macrococcus caseolyticus]QYA76255.1 lipoate--protein ligase family protein [Macrococcus caseolyticus]
MTGSIFEGKWQYVDHTTGLQPMQSFSFDDMYCHLVGQGNDSVVRTWVHNHVVILGIHDARLPYLAEGIEYLNNQGYGAIVRNSGGLGVVLDAGVLNISLIFKGDISFSIDAGYEYMYELVQEMFASYGKRIEAKEITRSYCPGSYDLSIDGKKFAGISQRRVKGGIAVQIYLCIEGSGGERAELMRQFYDIALNGQETKFHYPDIDPSCMASLEELLETKLSVEEVLFKLLFAMKALGATLSNNEMTNDMWTLYNIYFERMIERNSKLKINQEG